MNEITTTAEVTLTAKEKATLLDGRIKANARIAAESLVTMGKDLREMRDGKLYAEFGCENFSDYCEQELKISQRHAYNIIKCYEIYGDKLSSIQYLGITKLIAMTALEDEEREALIESGEAENLSSRELEKKIEELQKKCDQLTLELEEKDSEQEESETEKLLKKQNEDLSKELEALKTVQNNNKNAAENEKNKLKSELELLKKQNKELSMQATANMVKAKSEIKRDIREEYEKQREEDEKQHSEEVQKLKEQIAKAEEEKKGLQALAKKSPPDSQKERVKFYCEESLRSFNSALEAIKSIQEEDTKAKCKDALAKVVAAMTSCIEKEG